MKNELLLISNHISDIMQDLQYMEDQLDLKGNENPELQNRIIDANGYLSSAQAQILEAIKML